MSWILLTVAAAFLQNLRSMLQKRLTGALSVNGAAYARFCYALPFAWAYLAVVGAESGLPATNVAFWAYCAVASLAQMFATACLLAAFTLRSFAVSTALSKTEALQTALIGALLLGEMVSPMAAGGIVISLAGVLLLTGGVSLGQAISLLRGLRRPGLETPTSTEHDRGLRRGLALGLLAGTGLALASVGYRGAALALPEGGTALRAGLTLAVALGLQTLTMGGYLAWRERGELSRVLAAWRAGVWVGVCGAAASVGWFTAMTLQTSALVRALGQVELLFALAASGWVFRERLRPRELVGVAALVGGIYLLL